MNAKNPVEGKFDEGSGVRAKAPIMEVKYPNCAGIDIAKSEHWVALPADVERGHRVRKFGGYMKELRALSSWLKQNEIEQVAMERPGFTGLRPTNCWIGTDSTCGWSIPADQAPRSAKKRCAGLSVDLAADELRSAECVASTAG